MKIQRANVFIYGVLYSNKNELYADLFSFFVFFLNIKTALLKIMSKIQKYCPLAYLNKYFLNSQRNIS